MKKKYETPRVKILNLHIQDSLLLPTGSGTTSEALAPRFGGMDEFNTIDSSDQWGSVWEDEGDWSKEVGEGAVEVW